jgi:hypothetical protein
MNLRTLRWALLAYAAFDLFFGGICGGFLPLSPLMAAQFTTVSGTVADPNGLPYANGTISAVLNISASPTLGGLPYTPPTQPVGLSSAGSFVMLLADNTQLSPGGSQWKFQVCSGAGTIQPAGGNGPVCFIAGPITISGASQNISAQLQAVALALSSAIGGPASFSSSLTTSALIKDQTPQNLMLINGTAGALSPPEYVTLYFGAFVSAPTVNNNNTFLIDTTDAGFEDVQIRSGPGGGAVRLFAGSGVAVDMFDISSGGATLSPGAGVNLTAPSLHLSGKCEVNSASPAACGSSSSGAVVVPTTTTTYTVNTTATFAGNVIILTPMSFTGNLPGSPTCVVPAATAPATISAQVNGTSFIFSLPSTAGQTCWQFAII